MKSKISLKWSLFLSGIVGIIISVLVLFSLTLTNVVVQGSYLKSPSSINTGKLVVITPVKKASLLTGQVKIGLPVRLKIPGLKVDAAILSVGLTSGGAMDVPPGPYDVAWFKLGPRPGDKGSSVIAGHFGIWKNGAVSVFNKLYTLRKGDLLSIKDDKGTVMTFVVRGSKTYTPNADATEVFNSTDGKAHLNLVTCVFDSVSKTYPKRLVVFTDRVM